MSRLLRAATWVLRILTPAGNRARGQPPSGPAHAPDRFEGNRYIALDGRR